MYLRLKSIWMPRLNCQPMTSWAIQHEYFLSYQVRWYMAYAIVSVQVIFRVSLAPLVMAVKVA